MFKLLKVNQKDIIKLSDDSVCVVYFIHKDLDRLIVKNIYNYPTINPKDSVMINDNNYIHCDHEYCISRKMVIKIIGRITDDQLEALKTKDDYVTNVYCDAGIRNSNQGYWGCTIRVKYNNITYRYGKIEVNNSGCAELIACLEAIRTLKHSNAPKNKHVNIYTDCSSVADICKAIKDNNKIFLKNIRKSMEKKNYGLQFVNILNQLIIVYKECLNIRGKKAVNVNYIPRRYNYAHTAAKLAA